MIRWNGGFMIRWNGGFMIRWNSWIDNIGIDRSVDV